jgi:hypothetical protein
MLYVIVPRSLLAVAAGLQEWRLRHAPWSSEMYGYARRVLGATVRGTTAYTIQVVPYACELDAAKLAILGSELETRLGGNVALEPRQAIDYGGEDHAAGRLAVAAGAVFDASVLLLSLAATPEAENHGATLKAIRDHTERSRTAPLLIIAVDESGFAARFSHDRTLAHRLEERRSLWRDFVAGYGLEAWFVDLSGGAQAGRANAPV